MKKILISAGLMAALTFASQAQAGAGGSCHFHGYKPVAKAVVIDCANQRRDALVKAGKLDASWREVAHTSMELVDGQKGKEWKLVYQNPAIGDESKRSLYLFFAPAGHFIAANHSGK